MHSPNEHHLSGIQASSDALHDFAPGLERHLIQIFKDNANEIDAIRAVFQYSFTHGGREDQLIPRREDESYNPRCARLPQLLISEAMTFDALSIKCAVLMPLLTMEKIADAPTSDTIKSRVAAALEIPHSTDDIHTDERINLSLVNWIDHIRHVHISLRDKNAQRQLITAARTMLGRASGREAHPRLTVLLNHAINQQERRCTE